MNKLQKAYYWVMIICAILITMTIISSTVFAEELPHKEKLWHCKYQGTKGCEVESQKCFVLVRGKLHLANSCWDLYMFCMNHIKQSCEEENKEKAAS